MDESCWFCLACDAAQPAFPIFLISTIEVGAITSDGKRISWRRRQLPIGRWRTGEGVPMRLISIVSALVALAMPATAAGQSDLQAQLKGHSIVMRYTEVVQGRRRTGKIVWNQEIYISSRGRLFVRVNAEGKRRTARHEIAPGSENSGGATPFRWTENGLARGWRDRRGRMVRQTIEISRSGTGFTCRATITRSAFASGADHHICEVVVGNPLGGK